MNFGGAIFHREALVHVRHPRTYVFQTVFLAGLVLLLVPLWPTGGGGGAQVADKGRTIFEYGTLFEMILIALIAPALTANAITSEKDKNTLDILVLTNAGPLSIIFGKLLARIATLGFLLFLSLPVIFALLTLGGIDVKSIGAAYAILLSTAWLGGSLGILLSTILRKTTIALIGGYAFLTFYLASPAILTPLGFFAQTRGAGSYDARTAYASPFFDILYLFSPSSFVARESFAQHWWINPLISLGAGGVLALLSVVLLARARHIDRALGLRQMLEGVDKLAAGLMPGKTARKLAAERPGPVGNPIYWKETTVNTLGRFRHWWRMNLLIAVLLGASFFTFQSELGNIEFHKYVGGTLSGLLVITATMIAATSVSKEREDRTLFVLATTPVECAVYVKGKALGILRNISFLMLLPFIHVLIFILWDGVVRTNPLQAAMAFGNGPISAPSLLFVIIGVPVAAISAIVQGMFVSLVFPTTLRALMAAIGVVAVEALLPFCCCLPTFNPVLLLYFGIQPANPGVAASQFASWALLGSAVFSLFAHIGLTCVVYSLIRSGFDRYLGRAG
ncbi:ABC transporter permease subunit [bacterium]|nr:ABC transporter permease subunit [bacterium]